MGNMTITDGRTGSPHITAAEVWAANVGIWGDGDRLLSTGQNMRAQIINNNTVRIYDGVVSLQGLRCGIPYGQYIDMTIQNGTTGEKRRDAIYIEYTYNPTLRTMDTELKVKKGVSGTSYVSPTLQTGDIAAGALTHEGLLYYVDIDGLTIANVEGKMQSSTLSGSYAIGQVATQSNYTASYSGALGLTEVTSGGSGIEFNGGIFTIKDSRIKAVRIMAGGRYVPADSASTYVGFNRVMKNSEQALYEAVGYCVNGGAAMWSISGIVPVALNDSFTLQGKGSVSAKVGRGVGTNMSVEAIY